MYTATEFGCNSAPGDAFLIVGLSLLLLLLLFVLSR